jgi:hypothetical protein
VRPESGRAGVSRYCCQIPLSRTLLVPRSTIAYVGTPSTYQAGIPSYALPNRSNRKQCAISWMRKLCTSAAEWFAAIVDGLMWIVQPLILPFGSGESVQAIV